MGIAVRGRIGGEWPISASELRVTRSVLPCCRAGGVADSSNMLAGSSERVHTEGMDRVIGAAFSVLAQARLRLSQIRAEGEDPLVQLELTPGRDR